MNEHDVEAFERCIASGGVAIFPTDTVYGIGCDVGNAAGARRVALIKNRDVAKPSAVMFFSLERALEALPEREATILRLRFFEDLTQTEIAEEVGVSQMHVSRLLARSLAALRRQLQQAEPSP